MTLGRSECEGTRSYDFNEPVERAIPTYLESIRKDYSREIYENPDMYNNDELYEARKILKQLIEQANDVDVIKALCCARACLRQEQRRRWR